MKFKKALILFKICQMLHIPSCILLYFLIIIPQIDSGISLIASSKAALPFIFAAMGCFAINDYYDYEKDCINKPYRILPLGLISPITVLIIGYSLFIVSILFALINIKLSFDLGIYLIIIVLAYGYGRFINYLGYIKDIYTAAVLTFLFFYIMHQAGIFLSIFVYIGFICYVTGKELLMDVFDAEGDSRTGQLTLAVRYGKQRIYTLASALLFIGIASALTVPNPQYIATIAATIILSFLLIIGRIESQAWRRVSVYGLWIPLVICISGII